jgi:hypothetical protein
MRISGCKSTKKTGISRVAHPLNFVNLLHEWKRMATFAGNNEEDNL